jgi:hypothetical protein
MLFVILIGLPIFCGSLWLLFRFLGSRTERLDGCEALDVVCLLIQVSSDVLTNW